MSSMEGSHCWRKADRNLYCCPPIIKGLSRFNDFHVYEFCISDLYFFTISSILEYLSSYCLACFGGLLKHGDDEGDHMFGYLEQTIKSIKDLAAALDIESELSAPIGHMTKLEQWGIIDTEVQTQIWSCLTTNINQQCGKCYKCVDLEAVRNAVDFSK